MEVYLYKIHYPLSVVTNSIKLYHATNELHVIIHILTKVNYKLI